MRPRMLFIVLLAFAAAASVLRYPRAFVEPVLAVEDGRDVFGFYYNHRQPESVLRRYNGYLSLVPNLAGYAILALPTRIVPHALTLFPLLVSSLAFSWFSLRRFHRFGESAALRSVACLALVLVPIGNDVQIGNTMYSSWNLLLILALQSIAPPPAGIRSGALRFTGSSLLVCSHPASVLLLPLYALRLHRPRAAGDRLLSAGLAAITLLYVFFGFDRPSLNLSELSSVATRSVTFLAERVVFGTLFGDEAARVLYLHGWRELVFWSAALVSAILAWGLARSRRHLAGAQLELLLYGIYLIVALTLLYIVSRQPGEEVLAAHKAYRYFWVQRALFLILLVTLVGKGLLTRWTGLTTLRKGLVAAAASLWLTLVNVQNLTAYRVDPVEGERLAAFIQEVVRQEGIHGGRDGVVARLDRGQWSIVLDRRGVGGPNGCR